MAREMRGVNALEGPELGAIMAQAMQQRVRNNTTTAQRTALLREMSLGMGGGRGDIVEAPGARLAAGEAAMADDAMWRERIQNIHAMRRVEDRDIALAQREASMANAPGRGLQLPYDWGTSQTGAAQSEEDALMAQMSADAEQQRQANVSVDTAGTPGGFTTGENQYVQNLAQQEQFPQAFAGQGSSQFGGTELGMVPEGRRTEQGFSAKDYVPGEKQVQEQDLVGKKIMEFLSGAGLKEGAQGDPNVVPETVPGKDPNVAGGTTSSGSSQFTTQHGFGAKDYDQSGQQQTKQWDDPGGVLATGLGDTQMPPEERAKLDEIKRRLVQGRDNIAQNADQSVSQQTLGDDSGFPSIGGISGQVKDVGGAEQNAAIVNSLLKELEVAGIDANILRRFDVDVDKFLSGVYNMADVDKLMTLAKRAGVPASTRSKIQTMSDNVSGTSGRGFNSPTYDEGVRQRQGETFMEYTQRMHQRNKDMNQWQNPDNAWVDPADRV